MTVCVSAIADYNDAIIGIADQMLGAGVMAVDLPQIWKSARVHRRWVAMFAGTDIQYVPPILQAVKEELADRDEISVGEASAAFVRAYKDERLKIAEQTVLSPLGMNVNDFTTMLATHDSGEVTELRKRMQQVEFDCQFLVSGFDGNDLPHIFTIMPPGIESSYDTPGFWSIGSGSESALSQLLFRRFSAKTHLELAVYHVAEAKFMAECAMGVGQETLMWIIRRDGTFAFLRPRKLKMLRKIWKEEGQPPIPENLNERVGRMITFFNLGNVPGVKLLTAKPEEEEEEAV